MFFNPTHKTESGTALVGVQVGGRVRRATHWEQSNYLANQKQGAMNKYDLTVFIRLV